MFCLTMVVVAASAARLCGLRAPDPVFSNPKVNPLTLHPGIGYVVELQGIEAILCKVTCSAVTTRSDTSDRQGLQPQS